MSVDDAFRKIMEREPDDVMRSTAAEDAGLSAAPTPAARAAAGDEPASPAMEEAARPHPAEPFDLSRVATVERFGHSNVATRSQIAEEYRILRTRLQIVQPGKNSVMITSCRHGEGKSSTSLNLALFMAKWRRKKILLIDMDLRRPRLAKLFRQKPEVDFVDAVREKCAITETIMRSEKENLYLMPARREYSNATEVLESPAMAAMFDRLHATFDFIVVDTCPCLSTADPMVVGPMTGGALFVVRCRQTQRESLAHAVQALKDHRIPTLGVILTFMRYYIPRYFHRYQYYHDSYSYYEYYASRKRDGEVPDEEP